MTEDEKWQREIDLENYEDQKLEGKNKMAGGIPASGPVSYLCWWYFETIKVK